MTTLNFNNDIFISSVDLMTQLINPLQRHLTTTPLTNVVPINLHFSAFAGYYVDAIRFFLELNNTLYPGINDIKMMSLYSSTTDDIENSNNNIRHIERNFGSFNNTPYLFYFYNQPIFIDCLKQILTNNGFTKRQDLINTFKTITNHPNYDNIEIYAKPGGTYQMIYKSPSRDLICDIRPFLYLQTLTQKDATLRSFYLNILTLNCASCDQLLKTLIPRCKEGHFNQIFNKDNFHPYKNRLIDLEQQIDRKKNDIEHLQVNLTQISQGLNQLLLEYEALYKINEDESLEENIKELKEYFINHKFIKEINFRKPYLDLTIESPLIYYEKDLAEIYLSRRYDKNTLRHKIFTDIFINEKYRLWTYTKFNFDITNFSVEDITSNQYPRDNCYPHPHLNFYHCMGNFYDTIREWQTTYNYIGAMEQCMSMCFNLNFADSTVTNRLFDNIESDYKNLRCFKEVETEQFLSFEELFQKYKGEE